jgi:hypothetical protein
VVPEEELDIGAPREFWGSPETSIRLVERPAEQGHGETMVSSVGASPPAGAATPCAIFFVTSAARATSASRSEA